ncbi:MAG: ATP-dependent RecD-like DNA helicase [Desulfobacteraceae bacterium]|nr:MAG: ATP-dependent RecD-like DNA helicase [Desulfobacteraceae bacterium]
MIDAEPFETIIEGLLDHVYYFNAETHYTIARIKTPGVETPVTVVGFMSAVSPGETLKITGSWETHSRYGQQLKIKTYEVTLPGTADGIKKYLESGIIKGIGPSLAGRLVGHFGETTLEVIEKNPKRLSEISGIGKAKTASIENAWKSHHSARTLMQFLSEIGVKTSYCGRILKLYGDNALDLLKQDPYCIAKDIPGPGFYIADTIAGKLGFLQDKPERVRACLLHLMEQGANDGHVFLYGSRLIEKCRNNFEIDYDAAIDGIDYLSVSGEIVVEKNSGQIETDAVYLKELYQAETGLACRISAYLSIPVAPLKIDPNDITEKVQKKLAINLSQEQLGVIEGVFSHRIAVITGGPGTGKTTLIRSVAAIFDSVGKNIELAAPTGRAARRLSEVTGRKAQTIHRLLGYNAIDGCFDKNRDNPIEADAVIIDEASMVDTLLMYNLVTAVPVNSVLILVGDIFQLPSVGPGNILSDMINSGKIPVFYLSKIFRQAGESPIIVNAHRVREGEFPVFDKPDTSVSISDFCFIEQNKPDRIAPVIVELCKKTIPGLFGFDPVNDIQVLTPMHKGVAGTLNLNQMLQKALNPNSAVVETMGSRFKEGDKVMHLKNNYQKEVFNGDIGTVVEINGMKKRLVVNYYDRLVEYDFEELDEVSPAYAISVHKSQGSEYPVVIIPLVTEHYMLLQRNVLYTAITRGSKMVILIGSRRAFDIALKNDKPRERLSGLRDRLNL